VVGHESVDPKPQEKSAATRMTETVMNKDMLTKLTPEYIVPLVAYLGHDSCNETGGLFELGGGYYSKLRYQRSTGVTFDKIPTPEQIRNNFEQITDFNGECDYPSANMDMMPKFLDDSIKSKLKPNKLSATALKTDKIFNLMAQFIDAGEGKSIVDKLQSTYTIEIIPQKGAPVARSWILDLKTGNGKVSQGKAQTDATFTFTDDDFEAVCLGKLNPQQAFMTGKMKIKGNMKKATAFTPDLFPAPTPENIAKYQAKAGGASSTPAPSTSAPKSSAGSGPTLKTDAVFQRIGAFLDLGLGKEIVGKLQAVYLWEILPEKGKPAAKKWVIDLKNGQGSCKQGEISNADATFTMTDADFFDVTEGKLNPQQAFMTGKMKIKGNMKKATAFTPDLFPAPTPENLAKLNKPKL